MPTTSHGIPPTWISRLKDGEVSELLQDASFLKEVENGVSDSILIQSLCIISSKIYKMKNVPKEEVFGSSTTEEIFNISKLFCSASKKANFTLPHLKKFYISLYHMISLFLDLELYDCALILKDYIFIFGFRKECFCGDKTIGTSLSNLYSRFWNCSFTCEKNKNQAVVDDLRYTALKILCYTGSEYLETVSDRFMLIGQKQLLHNKNNLSHDLNFSLCSNLLETVVEVVNDSLKSNDNNGNSVLIEDSFVKVFKSFCQIQTEVIKIYNFYGKGIEGIKVCSDHCAKISDESTSAKYFCILLEVLQGIWSVTVYPFENRPMEDDKFLNFKTIYLKVCEIQNRSDLLCADHESENIDGINFKSLNLIKVTEAICVALADTIPKPIEKVRSELSERHYLYKLLRLSASLSFRIKNNASSMKTTAVLLKFIVLELDEAIENKAMETTKKLTSEIKEVSDLGFRVEELLADISFKERFALSFFAQSLQVAIEVLLKWKYFEEGEILCSKYSKFALKKMCYPEFSFLKTDSWWALKNLCVCQIKLEKFRNALSTLAVAIHSKTLEDSDIIMKEWVKVKIKAQLCDKINQLKLSSVYHMLKESISEEVWQFSENDLTYLLRMEINAYRSKNIDLSRYIKEACNALLEISTDPVARAEIQLHLLEISWHECSPLEVPIKGKNNEKINTAQMIGQKSYLKSPEKRKEKPKMNKCEEDKKEESSSLNMKQLLKLCEEIVEDLKKEITSRVKSSPPDVPIILCIMAQACFWKFLVLFTIKSQQGQKELSKLCSIPLKASSNTEDENSSCDVVTNQQSLKSSTKCNLLKSSLNIAVSFWENAIEKFQGMEISKSNVFRVDLMVKYYLQTAACIYELYDDLSHKVVMWSLLCQYANLCNDDDAFLLGSSNLMRIEVITLNETFLDKSEDIANKMSENSSSLFSYWIGKSWHLLLSSKLLEGLQYLKKFLDKCNPLCDSFQRILYAQAKYLLAVYCLHVYAPSRPVEPELISDPIFGDSSPRDSAISAVSVLINLLEGWNPTESLSDYFYAQSLLLDVSEWLGELFIDLCSPRESYGFIKEQFQLAQKLLLPNRTAWFLSLLARVDIMCQNIRDCEVKLKGMEMILDFATKSNLDPAVDKLEVQMQGLKVEESSTSREPYIVPKKIVSKAGLLPVASGATDQGSSPELPKSRHDFLAIPTCDSECKCAWCADYTFQKAFIGLIFVKVWVSFVCSKKSSVWKCQFSEHNNDLMKTTLKRNGELLLALRKKSSVQYCINGSQEHGGNFSWDKIYVKFLLHVVECHLCLWEEEGCNKVDLLISAEATNKLASDELKQIKPQFHVQYLLSKATLQKFTIDSIKLSLSSEKVEKESESIEQAEDSEFVNKNLPQEGFKTPEQKSQRVNKDKFDEMSSDDEGCINEPIPDSRVRVLPCLNLEAELEKEEKESKKKRVQPTKGAPRKKIVESKIEKPTAGVKVVKKNVTSNNKGKSLNKQVISTEPPSLVEVEDDTVISDSPGAVVPVSKIYKKRIPTLNHSLYSRVNPATLNTTKTISENKSGVNKNNHEPIDMNNDESAPLDQLLGAMSLPSDATPEKKTTRSGISNSKTTIKDRVRKKDEDGGKNVKESKKKVANKLKNEITSNKDIDVNEQANSTELPSIGEAEDDTVISDSPGAVVPVSRIYKKRIPTLSHSLYSRVNPGTLNTTKTISENKSGVSKNNHEPMDMNNDESAPLDQLLGATSLPSDTTPEKKTTRSGISNSKTTIKDRVKKKDGDGDKNVKEPKKKAATKTKTKSDSFIEDSDTEAVYRRPKRLPRNPFVKL